MSIYYIKLIFLSVMFSLFLMSCAYNQTGIWCLSKSNGEDVKGDWLYRGNEVQWFPGDEDLNVDEGTMVAWWNQDQKFCEYKYANGKPDGLWLLWHRNGILKCKGYYKEGQRVGMWLWYDENGTLRDENGTLTDEYLHDDCMTIDDDSEY